MRRSRLQQPGRVAEWNRNVPWVEYTGTNVVESVITGYRVLTFNSSGTFTVYNAPINIECLVIGGGGGGGSTGTTNIGSGGGGGGGFVTNLGSPLSFFGRATVTIGAGGSAQSNGSLSSFLSFVAYGGGAGDGLSTGTKVGSSGGGGYAVAGFANTAGGVAFGSPISQGFNGASGSSATTPINYSLGGGGGGAGAAASVGAGGAGLASTITGSSTTYGGGGGGGGQGTTSGAGGAGGGGSGATNTTGGAGTNNLGGGGGGSARSSGGPHSGGAGGNGVVIIRWAI